MACWADKIQSKTPDWLDSSWSNAVWDRPTDVAIETSQPVSNRCDCEKQKKQTRGGRMRSVLEHANSTTGCTKSFIYHTTLFTEEFRNGGKLPLYKTELNSPWNGSRKTRYYKQRKKIKISSICSRPTSSLFCATWANIISTSIIIIIIIYLKNTRG